MTRRFLLIVLLLPLLGCGARAQFPRLDIDSALDVHHPAHIGEPRVTTVVLSQRAMIERVVVSPREPIGDFEVEVRDETGKWQPVKSFDGRFTTSVTVRPQRRGDAVRVVERALLSKKQQGDMGSPIETILVYGQFEPAPSTP